MSHNIINRRQALQHSACGFGGLALAGLLNEQTSAAPANPLAATLKALGAVLGILQDDPDRYLKGNATVEHDATLSDAEIEQWIARRAQARADKNWAEADRIRDLFTAHSIHIEDTAGGSTWRRG